MEAITYIPYRKKDIPLFIHFGVCETLFLIINRIIIDTLECSVNMRET